MRVLVTGSEGFIGKNLCEFLAKRGIDVEGCDLKNGSRFNPNLNGFDAVIHLAANSSTTETNIAKIIKENFEFSKVIYNLCSSNNIKFQYSSSASVYGNSKTFQEDQFCSPLNPYGFSKYMFDCWLLNSTHPYQGLRYFNVYGKHEEHKGDQASPIHKFSQQAQKNGKIKVFKNSEKMKRDFVCVEDVCEAHYRLLHSDASGVFNVGTGSNISFLDVANIFCDKYGATIETIKMPKQLKQHYQYKTKSDNTRLIDAIGDIEWRSVEEYVKKI
jgi:ADP-L-glycero-D-manno-heptose 6-epimerase